MKEIKLTGGGIAIVDDADFEAVSAIKWRRADGPRTSYAMSVKIRGSRKTGFKYTYTGMHRLILGLSKNDGIFVDHINGNGLDNRRENLRTCTRAENNRNKRPKVRENTKYKGIVYQRDRKRWIAQIYVNKVRHHLGNFKSDLDAARAYDAGARRLHGEFARLNFP